MKGTALKLSAGNAHRVYSEKEFARKSNLAQSQYTIFNGPYNEWIMLKIANWNLERVVPNLQRAERITAMMSEIAADIWILTETHQDIALPNYQSVTSDEPDRESKQGECWVAVWTHFPIIPLTDFVSDTQRCAAARILHPDFDEVIVYATVLPWLGSEWRGIPSRGGAAFGSALAAYQCDWELLQQEYPDALFIVAGDFNQSLAEWHYYGSKRNRLKLEQAFSECGMHIITAGENDPVARDSSPWACIDHIGITPSTTKRVLSTQRWPDTEKPDKTLSDHFGVYIEISS